MSLDISRLKRMEAVLGREKEEAEAISSRVK